MAADTYAAVDRGDGNGLCVYAGWPVPVVADLDVILWGDSLTADAYPSNAYRASGLIASPGRLIYNAGIPNETVAEIAARFSADVAGNILDRDVGLIIRAGTNGPGGSGNFTTEYTALVNAALADSRITKIVLLAIPPKGLSGNAATFIAQNAIIEGLADDSRVFYVQDSEGIGDGSYNAVPSFYVDAEASNPIHMDAQGAYVQALVQASAYPSIFGARPDPSPTTGDNFTDNPASAQWVKNPLMAGAGPVATNWSVAAAGGGTSVTPSIVASDDSNTTPWQRMTIAGTGGAGHTCTISTVLGHPAVSSGGAPDRLEVVAQIRFNALNCAALDRLSVYMQAGANVPIPAWVMRLEGIGTITHTMRLHQSLARVAAQAFSGDSINLYFELSAAGSGGAAGSIDVRCVSVKAV